MQPSLWVQFEDAILFGDSIVKYFLSSGETNHASSSMTFNIKYNLKSEQLLVDSLLDHETAMPVMRSAYELLAMSLPDGSFILASNNFECDITYSELIFFDKDENIKWSISPWEGEVDLQSIRSIGIVNANVIAINQDYATPTLYFDLEGNEQFYDFPPAIYYNPQKINKHWYVTLDDEIIKLNSDFQEIGHFDMDSIVFIQHLTNGRILAGDKSTVILLDTFLNEVASTSEISNSITGTSTEQNYWVVSADGIYQLDSNLAMIRFFSVQANESIHHISANQNQAFVASTYNGIQHRDFVIRSYREDSIYPVRNLDLVLNSIQMPEKIIREVLEYPYIYTLRFDSLSFGIYNNSNDTIRQFNINYDWNGDYWCIANTGEWVFDIIISPHDSVTLRIDSFITEPIYFNLYSPFCFWVDYPDEETDVFPLNNEKCGSAEIITNVVQAVLDDVIKVYPNPAIDHIDILSGNSMRVEEISIYRMDGMLVSKYEDVLMPYSIPVNELLPGMYFIRIWNDQKMNVRHFVKI